MFLLSAQNNFYIILSSYVEEHVKKKNQVWISCLRLVSRPPKSGCFFGKIFVKLVWQSFLGRNNFLEPPVFLFSNSLPYGLEESRELWMLDFGLVGIQKYKKILPTIFFCFFSFLAFLSCHYGFTNYFKILIFAFSNVIPRGVSACKILLL